jgi:hypothetical protein
LDEKWWLDERFRDGKVVFWPAKITAQEITIIFNKAKKEFIALGPF